MSVTSRISDELLQRYFDGELPEEERSRVEELLTPEDRDRLAALRDMRAALISTLEHEAASVDIVGGVEAALRKERQDSARSWRDKVRGRGARGTAVGLLMAAAAAVVLILQPWHPRFATHGCDIESLEVEGAVAALFNTEDDKEPVIIWTEETEEN